MQHLTNATTTKPNDWCLIHKDEGKITQPPQLFLTYNKALKAMKKLGGNDGFSNGWFVSTTFALSRAKWA